jgi:methionyl-tRNA formyltransferase
MHAEKRLQEIRVVFAGTPDFAATALGALIAANYAVPLVLTQPDKAAGRGMKCAPGPVKQLAQHHGLAVVQPRSLRSDGKYPSDAKAAHEALRAANADVMVVAAYGLILPQSVLDIARRGCVNIHASLLPRWRGAAPIHRAIEAGDQETGITLMQMDAGLDTGAMLSLERVPILPAHTTGMLHDVLASLGARLLVRDLPGIVAGRIKPVAQPAQGVTYAEKIHKEEARIDWQAHASLIARRIRAFDPFPGAVASLRGQDLKLWAAQAMPQQVTQAPGTVTAVQADSFIVACGSGSLAVHTVQRPGGKRLPVSQWLLAQPLAVGTVFEASKTAQAA